MPFTRRLAAAVLSLCLVLPALPPVPAVAVAVPMAAAVALHAAPAEARASSSGGRSSSGGYSRPSRTPSFSPSRSYSTPSAPSRTPSTSGGYARPSQAPSAAPSGGGLSGGDLSVSRRSSGAALDRYRAEQERQRTPALAPPAGAGRTESPSSGYGGGWNSGSGWSWGDRRRGGVPANSGAGGWYGGWQPPAWATRSAPRFGLWDGLFLWFLLDHLSRPGYADWFHNHQTDPGYQQWRQEAERQAQDNAALRAKLDTLDQRLSADQGKPRDPDYLPPDVPATVARAETGAPPAAGKESGGGGQGVFVIILLIGVAVLAVWVIRRTAANRKAPAMSNSPLGTAAGILRQKLGGQRYEPSLFRVGMTFTLDPTPFLLAGPATKVTPPTGGGTNGLASVEAVSRLEGGGSTLHRLYLQGGSGFFQLHLGADGAPDECRWFSALDEVQPADSDEWAFWLDAGDGMIGYPTFQTKDGMQYARRWSPGAARIAPVVFTETLTDHRGSRTRTHSAMLYAAATGAADPAPATEYVLVAAVEDAGQAWVDIRAGIDVNPATLSLA